MRANVTFALIFAIFAMIITVEAQFSWGHSGHCPIINKKCVPRCTSDFSCGSNEKCCSNVCGSMSCVTANPIDNGNDNNGDKPVYCGGVKCGRYEKCVFDPKTKREKCVRT